MSDDRAGAQPGGGPDHSSGQGAFGSWDGGDGMSPGAEPGRGYGPGPGQGGPQPPGAGPQQPAGTSPAWPPVAPPIPATVLPAGDIVAHDRPARRSAGTVAATVLVVVALVLAGAGVKHLVSAASTSAAPAGLAPASTFAYAQVDLDPSTEQKLALLDLSRRIPGSPTGKPGGDPRTDTDNLRDTLLRSVFRGTPVDYDTDIGSWLGDYAAVAGFTDAAGKPRLLGLVAVKDQKAATTTLHRVAATGKVAYRFEDGYALIAQDDATLAAATAAGADGHLSGSDTFRGDMATLPPDELLLTWADGAKVAAAVGSALGNCGGHGMMLPLDATVLGEVLGGGFNGHRSCSTGATKATDRGMLAGRLVGGVQAKDGYLEGQLRLRGAPGSTDRTTDVSGMLAALPGDTGVAVGVGAPAALLRKQAAVLRALPGAALFGAGSLGDAFGDGTEGGGVLGAAPGHRPLRGDPLTGFDRDLSRWTGLSFPADVATLLGDQAVLAIHGGGDRPDVGLVTHPTDRAKARTLAHRLAGRLATRSPYRPVVRADGTDLIVASNAGYAGRLASGGDLGSAPRYRAAMGSTAGAVFGFYADLRGLGVTDASEPVAAVGLVVTRDGSDAVYRLRVVTH